MALLPPSAEPATGGVIRSFVATGSSARLKHFKYVPRGKRRMHKKPADAEIAARILPFSGSAQLLITVHPSALLRIPDEFKAEAYGRFVADLHVAARFVNP